MLYLLYFRLLYQLSIVRHIQSSQSNKFNKEEKPFNLCIMFIYWKLNIVFARKCFKSQRKQKKDSKSYIDNLYLLSKVMNRWQTSWIWALYWFTVKQYCHFISLKLHYYWIMIIGSWYNAFHLENKILSMHL